MARIPKVKKSNGLPIAIGSVTDAGTRCGEMFTHDVDPDLDRLIFRVRDRLGCGFGVTVVAPIGNPGFNNARVCVSWHRLSAMKDKDGGKRVVFARDLTTALEYVLEYERRYDEEGAIAAAEWHKAETKRREIDAEKAIEAARQVRQDGRP